MCSSMQFSKDQVTAKSNGLTEMRSVDPSVAGQGGTGGRVREKKRILILATVIS